MSDIALGVKVFKRTEKLQNLLESAKDHPIETVYVADDGERSDEKRAVYGAEYPFDLKVFDLEYDAGLGYGRQRIVEALDEEYLLIVDSDHELLGDVSTLREQLAADPQLGGVSGLLLENGTITGTCHDLYERGTTLLRDVRGTKPVRTIAGAPFVPYEFVPNVAMFRRACLEDYGWDPEYVIGKEHLDFYVGHKRTTDWTFGVCPDVLFEHHPGGGDGYLSNREGRQKLQRSRQYFLEKWGYDRILLGQTEWFGPSTRDPHAGDSLVQDAAKSLLLRSPPALQSLLVDGRDALRRLRGKQPL